MAVVSTTRTGTGQTLSDGRQGLSLREVWEVLLDAPSTIGHLEAKGAAGLPYWGQRHPNEAGLICVDRNVRQKGTGTGLYEVEITYGPPSMGRRDGDEDTDEPTARPFRIQTSWVGSREAVDIDYDGNPIVNSADEPPDPPGTEEIFDRVYTITGTMSDHQANRSWLNGYHDTVNEDSIYGYGPGRGRMRTKYVRMVTSDGRRYLDVTVEIVFRTILAGTDGKHAWDRRLLDQGTRTKTVTNGVASYRTITGDDGQPVSQPVPLDGKGGQLAEGGKPVWKYFKRHGRRRFKDFGLPSED